MSARFGRNKRREAREAIAKLESVTQDLRLSIDMDRALLADQNERLYRKDREIELAKEIAGPQSALFPSTRLRTGVAPADVGAGYEVRIDEPQPFPASIGDEELACTVRTMPLDVFMSYVDEDWLRQTVHATLEFKDKTTAYAIARGTLDRMSEQAIVDLLRREVVPHMARQLIQARNNRKGGFR